MRLLALLSILLTVASVACGRTATVEPPVVYSLEQAADSIAVPFGATVTVDRILLTFVDVPADSRCGTGLVCVWEGDATVRVNAALPCTRATPACKVPELVADLHTRLQPRMAEYAGIEIRLVALTPWPEATTPVRKDRYVAWFRLQSKTS